jgi:hypothetical protein
MEIDLKDNLKMIIKMVLEFSILKKIKVVTKEIGNPIRNLVKVN